MKYIILIISAFIFHSGFSQSSFNGIIHLNTENFETKEKANVACYISNGNARMDFKGTADGVPFTQTLLFISGNKNAILLTETQGKKIKYEIPVQALKSQQDYFTNAYLEKINENDFLIENMNYSTQIQLHTSEFNFRDLPPLLRKSPVLILLENNGIKQLPKTIVTKDISGTVIFTQNITEIIPQNIPGSQFEIPADYRNFSESDITVE